MKITEKQFQQLIITLAVICGWMHFHVYDSRRCVPGYPDLHLVRGPDSLFRELKVGKNKLSKAQKEWIEALEGAGHDVGVWRPEDWPEIERRLR